MMLPSASPGESSIEQARNGGVPQPPAHVGPDAAAVGPLEESSGRQDPDFLGPRRGPNQLSPDDSGSRRPRPVRLRPMGGRRDEDSPADLLSPSSGSRSPAQGRPEGAPCGPSLLTVVGFCFLTFNSGMAIYRSWGDTDAVSFVVSAYFTMLGLFVSIKKFLSAPPNSTRKKDIMVCVWFFTLVLASESVYHAVGTTTKPSMHLTLLLGAMPAAIGASVFTIFWDRFGAPQGEGLPDLPLAEELV